VPPVPPLTLRTPRLALRELREDDWVGMRALDTDPEVMRYTPHDVRDEAATRAYVATGLAAAQEDPRRVFDFVLTFPDEDRFLGRAGFHVARPEHREAMLWFTLRKDLWGKGLVTEAAKAVLDFAFDVAGVHRVYGDCDPRNVASAKVMEKLGLRREAHLRENWWVKGEWCDSFIYAVLEDEWRARRRG
jgi:ribosomal-protein-alanine N-acetyltransferase